MQLRNDNQALGKDATLSAKDYLDLITFDNLKNNNGKQ